VFTLTIESYVGPDGDRNLKRDVKNPEERKRKEKGGEKRRMKKKQKKHTA
jgi:hypothetical protein